MQGRGRERERSEGKGREGREYKEEKGREGKEEEGRGITGGELETRHTNPSLLPAPLSQ